MALQDEIREDLQNEVFGEFGKTVTLINKTTPIYNDRGELEEYTETTSSITAVPYDIVADRRSPQPFGELDEGDLDMAIPYTVTIGKTDLIRMEGDTYKVTNISKNYLPDNVVTIIRLAKVENLADDN